MSPMPGGKPRRTWRLLLGMAAFCAWWYGGGARILLTPDKILPAPSSGVAATATLLLGVFIFPSVIVLGIASRRGSLARFLVASALIGPAVCLAVSWILRGLQLATAEEVARLLRSCGLALFPIAGCWLLLRKSVANNLRSALAPALVCGAALLLGVLSTYRLWECDDDFYMPDSAYSRVARLARRTSGDCRVRVALGEKWQWRKRGGAQLYRLPPDGAPLLVHNPAAKPKEASLSVLVANLGANPAVAELRRAGTRVAAASLLPTYNRKLHSRNYHKKRSNVQVLATTVRVPPGETEFRLRAAPAGERQVFALLAGSTPSGVIRQLRRIVRLCDLADTRETFELSMSMTDRLWPYTVDYDEGDLPGGGYTSVEPPLHHGLNALAVTLLRSPSMRSMAYMFVAVLLVTYGVCCITVRRLSGRLGWLTALTLACVFLAYTTFVRPGVEGTSPDTTFLMFFMIAAFLMAAPEGASRGDGWLIGTAIVLATLTQYYATPLFCLAAAAHVAVFRQPKRSAGWALVAIAAGLGVMALRVVVAMATHSEAALFAALRDQNLARYFGLALEIVLHGRGWLLPYLFANYAHLLFAVFCASGFLMLLAPWLRRREAVFFALTALLIFLFVGVPGFQRSHYVAPIIVPLVVGAAIGLESAPLRRRRLTRQSLALVLAAAGLGVCLWAGRDYTGKLEPFSFWCRSANVARSTYFLRETIDAAGRGDMGQAERCAFKSVLADPQPTPRGVAYTALADGYLRWGDLDQACAAAKRAIESEPNMDHAYVVLAEVAARRGDMAEAETRLREALRADPQSSEAALAMAKTLLARGERQEAAYYAHRARRLSPEDPAVLDLAKELGLSP